MLNKKYIFVSAFIIFFLSFFTHNIYTMFPNFITSLLFPVNESIWEHTKMIFITWIIYYPIQYLFLKKYNYKNIITSNLISLITNIVLLLILFTPIYFIMKKKEILLLTLLIYFITIILSMIINYYILKNKKIVFNKTSIFLIIIIFIIYSILTYYPIKNPLFYDYNENFYGIKKS